MTRDKLIAKRSDHQTSHVLHLLMSLITMGLWIPLWVLVAVSHANERRKIDKQLERLDR